MLSGRLIVNKIPVCGWIFHARKVFWLRRFGGQPPPSALLFDRSVVEKSMDEAFHLLKTKKGSWNFCSTCRNLPCKHLFSYLPSDVVVDVLVVAQLEQLMEIEFLLFVLKILLFDGSIVKRNKEVDISPLLYFSKVSPSHYWVLTVDNTSDVACILGLIIELFSINIAAQGDSFAAKRIRKSGQRRAVDYTSTVVRYIQVIWVLQWSSTYLL